MKRSEGKGAGSAQRSDLELERGATSGLGAVRIVVVDPRGSVIITERVEGEVGAAMGGCAALTVGVVGVGEREIEVVGGSFATFMVGAVVVGEVRALSGAGVRSVSVVSLLRGKSFRRLPYLSHIGRGLLRLVPLLLPTLSTLSGGLELSGLLVWVSLGVVGEVFCNCQEKKFIIGEGVGRAAWACQRVGWLVAIGSGDSSWGGAVVGGVEVA